MHTSSAFDECSPRLKKNLSQNHVLNTNSLLMAVLSMAPIMWIAAISWSNTANAVMHEAGLAASNITQTNSNNATISAAEGQESSNATTTVVRDSVFAYLD